MFSTRSMLVAAIATSLTAVPSARYSDGDGDQIASFRPLAVFNVPGGTSAEIVSATPDGKHLVYSDSIGRTFGYVDIRNPEQPTPVATVPAGGDPTSVAVLPDGGYAIGAVQPGQLLLIDLSTFTIVARRAIGPGPDSIAVGRIAGQLVAVVAIENEGALGKGYVEVIRLNLADFASSPGATVTFDDAAALSAAGLVAVDDPQPEYVALRGTRAAVTLQENNGIAVIDLSNPAAPVLESLASAGNVTDRAADLEDDDTIAFVQSYPSDAVARRATAGARMPDGITWTADGARLFTADEGEEAYEGGRGFSAHAPSGGVLYDDAGSLEATAVRFGHYPDARSDAKGIEAEGIATGVFGRREFLFVTSERGAFVAVYRLVGGTPRFVQLLPTGEAPESVLAIPSRGLFVTANEGDDADGTISIFAGVEGVYQPPPDRPRLESRGVDAPWGAISGLTSHGRSSRVLFAVPDNALPSAIYRLLVGGPRALVQHILPITRDGEPARYDLEGIVTDTTVARPKHGAGFWLASEGNARTTRNILIQVDAEGRVLREIFLPMSVDAPGTRVTSNGFEGVAVSCNGRALLVALQRPFTGDQAVDGVAHSRIARYDLLQDAWDAFFYPLVNSPGTIGLSEITLIGCDKNGSELYAVVERDNRLAGRAVIKRLYTFTLDGLTPVLIETPASAGSLPGATITKTLLRDLLPLFTPYEKVEGVALTPAGDLWVALDNDGGEFESRLVKLQH